MGLGRGECWHVLKLVAPNLVGGVPGGGGYSKKNFDLGCTLPFSTLFPILALVCVSDVSSEF